MNETDLLLQMMEQPQRYTADEWQEILADDECRELYAMMSKTQSAVDAARADETITDEIIDAEWDRLAYPRSSLFTLHLSFYKIAAVFMGVLMLSGLAYAAFHIVSHLGETASVTTISHTSQNHPARAGLPVDTLSPLSSEVVGEAPKLYDNVPLGEILEELSDYYHVKVVYRNEAVSRLRLYYQWKPEYTLEKVIEMMNNFEWLQLQLENDTLIVSSTTESQP